MIITHLYKFYALMRCLCHYRRQLCGKNVHHPESVTHYIQFAQRKSQITTITIRKFKVWRKSLSNFFTFGFEKQYVSLNSVSDSIYTNGFNRLLFQNKRCGWILGRCLQYQVYFKNVFQFRLSLGAPLCSEKNDIYFIYKIPRQSEKFAL